MSASCVSVGLAAGSRARPQSSTHLVADRQEVDGEVMWALVCVGLVCMGNQFKTPSQLPLSVSSPFRCFLSSVSVCVPKMCLFVPFVCLCVCVFVV